MSKTRQEKEMAVEKLVEKIRGAKGVVFANFQGLSVSESEALRRECRKNGVSYIATKKTLVKRALDEAGISTDTKTFDGGIAVVSGAADEVLPAKIIADFGKTHETVRIFGGILEGLFIDAIRVKALAALPSKQELYAKLVGSLNAPVSGLVRVLAGNIRGLITALHHIREKKAA